MAHTSIVPNEADLEAGRMALIAAQNDAFRTSGNNDPIIKGQIVITQGVAALDAVLTATLFQRLVTFDAFTEDNDP